MGRTVWILMAMAITVGTAARAVTRPQTIEAMRRGDAMEREGWILLPTPPPDAPVLSAPRRGVPACAGDLYANAVVSASVKCEGLNEHTDPRDVLGPPDATGTGNDSYANFLSLGLHGWVVVDLGPEPCEWAVDEPGDDILVHQYVSIEPIEVLVSNSPTGPWVSLGVKNTHGQCPALPHRCASFDLASAQMDHARYVKVYDRQGDDPDWPCYETSGADIDAVEILSQAYYATATPTPTPTATPTPYPGLVRFDHQRYGTTADRADVILYDPDPGDDPATPDLRLVHVWSGTGDPAGFDLTLGEEGPASGRFTAAAGGGTIGFSLDTSNATARILRVASPDTLHVRYVDASPPGTDEAIAWWDDHPVPFLSWRGLLVLTIATGALIIGGRSSRPASPAAAGSGCRSTACSGPAKRSAR